MSYQAVKIHAGTLKSILLGERSQCENPTSCRIPTIWGNSLWKRQNYRDSKKGHWLPGVWEKGERDEWVKHRGFLGQ